MLMSRRQSSISLAVAMSCGFGFGIGFGCSFTPPGETPEDAKPDIPVDDPPAVRENRGLVAFWRFDEVSGDKAADSRMSIVSVPAMVEIPLKITPPGNAVWVTGGLRLDAAVHVGAKSPHVDRDVLRSGEVTMEVWV